MCGRYVLRILEGLEDELGARKQAPHRAPPRYNICPTQTAPIVRTRNGERELATLRWGLVPSWGDIASAAKMINARAETVASKPSFRQAFRSRRCLVPADGFYEWQKTAEGKKQPFFFHLGDDKLFAFAGIWETKDVGEAEPLETYTIITTGATGLLGAYHERMPVMLPRDVWGTWLADTTDAEAAEALLTRFEERPLSARPVSTRVNNPRFDEPSLLDPFDAASGPG